MSIRTLIVRSALVAAGLVGVTAAAGSAEAREPWISPPEHGGACTSTGDAPGAGYRDMNVRFERLHRIPSPEGVAAGAGYRDIAQLPRDLPPTPGLAPGYRDALVRFNRMDARGNAIASGRCGVWTY